MCSDFVLVQEDPDPTMSAYDHIGKVVKIDVKVLRRWWSSSWSN